MEFFGVRAGVMAIGAEIAGRGGNGKTIDLGS